MDRIDDLHSAERRWTAKYEEALARLENDRNGESFFDLSETCRYLGALRYKLSGDVDAFRRLLKDSAEYQIALYDRLTAGYPVARSFVDYASFNQLFDACASCDFEVASKLALLKLKHDDLRPRSFWHGLSQSLSAVVLDDDERARDAVALWRSQRADARLQNFGAYRDVIWAVHQRNGVLLSGSLSTAARGHAAEVRKGGQFFETEHSLVSIWIVGICCLARSRGLEFALPESPYVPNELTRLRGASD